MTEPLSKSYEPREVEGRWYPFWMERGYFKADPRSTKPRYCIVQPPPNVTGSLHLGHALTATIEDLLIRWKRMSGYDCLWMPGVDHAGIATQLVVDRELRKTEKKSRHDLGREAFVQRVWQWKEKYGARITEQHKVLGASLDWSRERFTMDPGSSLAVKEVFVRLYDEGLIYRAQRLINWCPECLTALSDLEVEHEERQGSLWHIAYPVKGTDRKLVVATTRPETMLGDTAVAIHPEDPRYEGLAGKTVVLPLVGREIPIIADAQLVDREFGTGVVKVTPAHDFNDYQTGLRHKLPMISIFDERARTNENAGEFAGLDRLEARKRVLAALTEQGLLVEEKPHKLSVAICERSGTLAEPRLSPQWFVKIEPLAKPALEAVETGKTRFLPETWTQTYFHWMRNIHDWCISRQLWWGHQIPAYYCVTCSPKLGADTDLPLGSATTKVGGVDFERAKPVVSREAPKKCADCGGDRFEQDPDVLDTWFSSALWPFSTLGWPNQTPELARYYPNDVMETGSDIIFFWVARMMMMGIHFMKDVPFRTVYLHAMIRDDKGEKMSKVKGNVIDPLDVVQGQKPEALLAAIRNKFPQGMPAYGTDALRFTLAALTQQGRDIKLSFDRVAGYKAFCNKLWNAARFALMNLEGYVPDGRFIKERPLTLADRWILSRLQRTIVDATQALTDFHFSEAAGALYQFTWRELCDWYIELSKISLNGKDPEARASAQAVLVHCLDHVLRLLHPFMPFITEEIWQKLPLTDRPESIMIARYPERDRRLEDSAAEVEMAPVVAAIEGLRSIRGESNLPPATKIEAQIQTPNADLRKTLVRWQGYVMPLAGVVRMHIGPPAAKPAQSASYVGERMEIFVPLAGVIDLGEERSRLGKEIARVEKDLASLSARLENPSFVARAPADVVQNDRARIDELKAKRSKLQDNLKRIAPEDRMSEESKPPNAPNGNGTPPVSSFVQNPETAEVRIAAAEESGQVDLGRELKGDLEAVKVPDNVDPQVKHALEKLRQGTKEGLSASDHYNLGVAYMGMGLVDDAVREFNAAKKPAKSKKAPAKAKKGVKKVAKSRGAKKKVSRKPKKKAPARKAKKRVSRRR